MHCVMGTEVKGTVLVTTVCLCLVCLRESGPLPRHAEVYMYICGNRLPSIMVHILSIEYVVILLSIMVGWGLCFHANVWVETATTVLYLCDLWEQYMCGRGGG